MDEGSFMAINADGSIHTEGAVAADPFMNLLFQAAMGLIEKKRRTKAR